MQLTEIVLFYIVRGNFRIARIMWILRGGKKVKRSSLLVLFISDILTNKSAHAFVVK